MIDYRAFVILGFVLYVIGPVSTAEAQCGPPVWTQRLVSGPSARLASYIAYDSDRGVVVLFGGGNNSQQFDDTWEWNGIQWSLKAPAHSPSPRWDGAMSYDRLRQRCVLFGGHNQGQTHFDETWTWDGNDWLNVTPAVSPSARSRTRMAFDESQGVAILFGGALFSGGSYTDYADTWAWNGATWSQRSEATGPTGRRDHAMCFDSARNRVLMFSGASNSGNRNDTWEGSWNAGNFRWTQVATNGGPIARFSHSLAFDSTCNANVLFGGAISNGVPLGDTWTWDGSGWAQRANGGPAARQWSNVAFHQAQGVSVLFGGTNGTPFADTWVMAQSAPLPGDLNGDCAVSLADLAILLAHFGAACP